MAKIIPYNIVFVNMDTLSNTLMWDGQLTAGLANGATEVKTGDFVFALRDNHVVAAGRISEPQHNAKHKSGRIQNGHIPDRWVRMNLHATPVPVALSSREVEMIKATAAKHGCSYPGFEEVLPVATNSMPCFDSLFSQCSRYATSRQTERFLLVARLLSRKDKIGHEKIKLLWALDGNGPTKEIVLERDKHRIVSDHELVLVATRIVPWETCTDFERTDPNNYVLMDGQLAEHFAMGMVTFEDNGNQLQDPAMDRDAFDSWVDPAFCLPELTAQQKEYMAYHRKHVFKQWRTNAPKATSASDNAS